MPAEQPRPMRRANDWAMEILGREEYRGDITLGVLVERIQADAIRAATDMCEGNRKRQFDEAQMQEGSGNVNRAASHRAMAKGCAMCVADVLSLIPDGATHAR